MDKMRKSNIKQLTTGFQRGFTEFHGVIDFVEDFTVHGVIFSLNKKFPFPIIHAELSGFMEQCNSVPTPCDTVVK
jgi:hypothetical protein